MRKMFGSLVSLFDFVCVLGGGLFPLCVWKDDDDDDGREMDELCCM